MTNIANTTVLALVFCVLHITNTLAEPQTPSDCNKAQVVIIGTIHDFHYESPKYKPEVLKEIIISLKPDAILNELPLSQVNPNGRPISRHYLQSPECWAADSAATELGIKQIPFDRPDREENFKKTNYWERQKRANELIEKWDKQIRRDDPNSLDLEITMLISYAEQAEAQLFLNGAPNIINSESHDSIVRIKHSLWHDILPTILKKYPGYETLVDDYRFEKDQWCERNKIMAENIKKATKEYPGKRLVVVTGATHHYTLRDLLKDEESIELKEYWELVDFDLEKCLKSIPPPPQVGIVADGLTKEQASQEVAKQFWQTVIKKDWELVNKLRPPVEGVNWEQVYSKNMPVELIEVKEAHWPKQGQFSGPLAPCVVRFEDGKILQIEMVPRFRKISGKMLCFITATWGQAREVKSSDKTKGREQ
jgi:hypothetical protein